MIFKTDYIREQFPCLSKTVNGMSAAFLDGPGGTQVPRRVVEKINDYLLKLRTCKSAYAP